MQPIAPDLAESLIRRESRAGLSFIRLLRLYLDPGALFKDASRGSLLARQQARRYNVRYRWMLLTYVRRWMTLAVFFFAGVGAAEALGPGQPFTSAVAASFAVAFCVAVTVSVQTFIAYLLLGASQVSGSSR
ncbi:MAG TPA: hypothetical protein VFP00_05550 [Burkholderiales bacterium]|nr:hypothetical protein [Burkholderiales bacterium]